MTVPYFPNLDSAFGDIKSPPIKLFLYGGRVWTSEQVNYIAQGHAHRHMKLPLTTSLGLVQLHNRFTPYLVGRKGHLPSQGELWWTQKGWLEYNQRKDW